MEVFTSILGLAMLASWIYAYVFVFQNYKNAPNTFAKIALWFSVISFGVFMVSFLATNM